MNYTKTTRRKKSTTKILNHIWIHTLLAVVKTDTCIYAFSSLESQEQKSSQPIYKLRQTGRWTDQAATHLSVQGQTHRPSNYPPFWWRTDIHRLRSHPPFWRRTDTQTDQSATHLSDEGQMDWLSSYPPFWQRTDTQIDWTATHLSDEGQTEQPPIFLTKDRQQPKQPPTFLTKDREWTKQPPTFLTKDREQIKQPPTDRPSIHPPSWRRTESGPSSEPPTRRQTDGQTKQPATHRQTKQKPTFLTNLGGLCACDAEDAELGQNEAVGVDEDVGVDGGEQQAGHERQQQGVSQVLQVHVEDGQHQAQRLVQLLCLAPLQHFLLGWWREGEKNRGGNILWQPKCQAVCRLQLSEPSPRCKV